MIEWLYQRNSRELENLRAELKVLNDKLEALKSDPKGMSERVADLEVKMAKLWTLLLETTPRGQDKLSKFGKRFGGASQSLMK